MKSLSGVLLALAICTGSARAAAITWTGGASGDWNVAANWTPASVPGAFDAVSIPSGTVVAYSTDPALGVLSMTLGEPGVVPAAVLQASTGVFMTGTLLLQEGAALQVSTDAAVAAGDVTLLAGTSIAFMVDAAASGTPAFLRIYASGTFNLAGGSTVTVRGRGYAGGTGLSPGFGGGGGGAGAVGGGGGGGGHGAAGGAGAAMANGGPAFDALLPAEAGAGGGGTNFADGAPGGGALRIHASTAVLDGLLDADGGDAVSLGLDGAGGGAGGSVIVTADVLRGTGTISARGGTGGTGANVGGGGGGGGRLWILERHYASLGSTLTLRATGGSFGAGAAFGAPGQGGTVFLDPQHWTGAGVDSVASNGANWSGGAVPLGGARLVFGSSATAKACIWDLQVAPSSATILPQFSTSVVLASSFTVPGTFDMAGGTMTSAPGLVLRVDGELAQTGGRLNLSFSTIAVAGAGGARTIVLVNASARNVVIGGAGAATATVTGSLTVSSSVFVGADAQLALTTGTLTVNGAGFLGTGGVTASTGHWTVAGGGSTQTWTKINGNLGSLRVSNASGGLTLSTAAGSSFSLTGGLTVDPAAVLRATGAFISVASHWSAYGTVALPLTTVTFEGAAGSTLSVVAGGTFDHLRVDGAGAVVRFSTTVVIGSTMTIAAGTLDLAASTVSVRGGWSEAGGLVLGGTSRLVFDGTSQQVVVQGAGGTFSMFASSSSAGVTIASALAATSAFEWDRGSLDFAGRALSIGGDMLVKGNGVGLSFAGSTVTLSGVSTQTVNFTTLDTVIVDNYQPVKLGFNSTWGGFTVNPGRFFDGGIRTLAITGDHWNTALATYTSVSQQHAVTWTPASSITVGAGSIVNARLALAINKTAVLQGGLFVDGAGNSLDPRQGSTVVNAPGGSTITFRGSSDLSPSSGANWFYTGDVANSWMVFEGTGGTRGAFISTNTIGSVKVSLSSNTHAFQAPNLNLLGSLVLSTGTLRPLGARTITLGGDLLQLGGLVDFGTASTGTIRLVSGGTQTVALLPGTTLWNLVAEGTGTVVAVSAIRTLGDFTVAAGTFQAGAFNHFLLKHFVTAALGTFDGQGSTVTFNGGIVGQNWQSITFLGGGSFNGLVQATSSMTFRTSTEVNVLTDSVAGSTIGVAAGATLTAGDFRMGAASGTPLRLRSTIPGSPWFLNVLSASSVTLTAVSDSDASGGITIDADDARSVDLGGNVNWDFTSRLLVILPGEVFTPGLSPGKMGAAAVSTAGVPITVDVRAVSSRFDQTTSTAAVTLATDDIGTAAPAALALVAGATSFTLIPRGAEPSPRTTLVTATASFASGAAPLSVIPNALARLQLILPGEAAVPGTITGMAGGASARVKGVPFSATVRAVDSYWNVISSVTDTAALSISAASATLPAPQALAGGQAVFSGIIVYSTGTFTLSATDVTAPGVTAATSSVFGVSPPSNSSPTLSGFVPNGARVATLGGGPSGSAFDGSSVGRVMLDLRDLDAALHFDWNAQTFSSVVPFFATATLGSPLGVSTTWFRAASEAAFTDGRRIRLTAQAQNPTGLMTQETSTFTFDRGMLAFGASDGQGFAGVSPSTAAGCEEITTTLTLTVGASGIGPGGALAARAPAGWTLPLGTTAQFPPPLGYWHAASTSLAASLGSTFTLVSPAASGPVALGPGWLLLSVATASAQSFLPGQNVVLTYRARPPFGPAGRGVQPFGLMTRGSASGGLQPLAASTGVTLGAGTTSFLTFLDPSPLSLTPLTASGTMQFLVADLCGNPKPGISSGTVALSLYAPGPGVSVQDATARFYNAAGGQIYSIGLSTGLAASASPSFSVWTATDAPAELLLRATVTFSGSGFGPMLAEASRAIRLRAALPGFTAVSIDTGTLAPGATSAALSAADPAGSAAQIRFTFAEPDLPWDAVVSSDGVNFTSPVLSAAGFGDAARPIVLSWNGLDRTRPAPAYPAAGSFKVRLRAGGGAALDRSLVIVVPETAGYAGRLGARGAGARVRASGPGAGDGRFAVASSTGYFELRGLRAGQRYEVSATTASLALGRPVALSTAVAAAPAASPLADLGSLGFPATGYLRVALLAPAPAPREAVGGFIARLPDGTAAFSGTLRLSSGSASSDDGGPLFGRSASTWSVVVGAPGLYDVDIEVPDLGLSTRAAGVLLGAGAGTDLTVSLVKKANVFGWVVLPSTVAFGTFVTVQARREGEAEPGAYSGFYISSAPLSGPSSGAFSLYGLDPGTWTILARAPGFAASSTTLAISGTSDVLGANLALGMGATITGTLTVPGDTRAATQCFPAAGGGPGACPLGVYEVEIEALGVGRLDRYAARLRLGGHVSFSSAAFVLSGLEAGAYTVRASLPGFALAPPQGASAAVAAGGTAAAALSLTKLEARLRVNVQVPPLAGGACRSTTSYRSLGLLIEPDGAAPLAFGDATAMGSIEMNRVQISSTTGAFIQLHCSSVTAFSPALPPGGVRVSVLFAANGGLSRSRAALVDGTTSTLSLDVSGSTYAVTGSVSFSGVIGFSTKTAGGIPFTVAVSSVEGILNVAPRMSFCVLGSGNPTTLPSLRAELIPFDPLSVPLSRAANSASNICAAPVTSTAPYARAAFLASIGPDGRFGFSGVSPGLYRLRVPGDLDDDAANGPEAAEAQTLILVGTSPVTGASLRLSRGRRVSGRVFAPPGLANGRLLRVTLTDPDGRAARSAEVACGVEGAAYALDGVSDGRYRLDVADLGAPAAWTAAPVEVVVAGADLDGRDTALVAAGAVRARLSFARPLPDGTEEHVLVSRENAFLLPRGFSARAIAVPYAAGGSVGAAAGADGSIVDADGRVVIAGLLPGTYDVEFSGPDAQDPGAVAFAPARVSGVTLAAGQAADLGVVPLFSGAVVSGLVTDSASGLPVAGAIVAARSSSRSGAVEERRGAAFAASDSAGRYVLRGLSPSVRWYDVTASAAGHAAVRASALDVSSGAARDFALAPAAAVLTGRVASSDGAALFSALGGAAEDLPGAALFLQRAGVLPADDPLADLALRTEPDGRFTIPSLATGAYRLTAAASGQAGLVRAVAAVGPLTDLGTLTLGGGGTVSGSLRLPDGSPVPDDELRAVAAVTADLGEFIYGSVTRDAGARAAVAYKIGGLRAGRAYRLLVLTASDETIAPSEAASVVLTSTSDARVLNLVVRPPAPTVSARSRRVDTRVSVEFLFSRPLRARSASDDDASLVVSTAGAAGALSGARLSSDRRRLTVDYDPGVAESSFTLRASAPTSALDYDAVDPAAARELIASATASFYIGETGAQRASISNAAGGTLASEGDAGRVVLPRGAFLVDASSSVTVTLRRSPAALGTAALGLAPMMRAAAAALPATLPARSDFYEIELPAGTPSTLARPAQLTLVYSSGIADPSALNLYWYNPGSGEFVLQPDALGGPAALDASARTLTYNVGHFSTFVLLASGAGAIGGAAHSGSLEAYNFPNPFDLQIKTVTTIHGAGMQTVRGTMVRVSVPPGLSGAGKLRVFDVTGREIRSIDLGALAAGQTYYQGWDGRNDGGSDVASGLYIGVVEVGSRRKSFKMAVIK